MMTVLDSAQATQRYSASKWPLPIDSPIPTKNNIPSRTPPISCPPAANRMTLPARTIFFRSISSPIMNSMKFDQGDARALTRKRKLAALAALALVLAAPLPAPAQQAALGAEQAREENAFAVGVQAFLGAHHCHAATLQALNDVGFTIPAGAGGGVFQRPVKSIPKPVQQTLDILASNTAHLARLLKRERYPGVEND